MASVNAAIPHDKQATRRASDTPIRLRYARTMYVAILLTAVCALPLAIALEGWGVLVLIPFVLAAVALSRVGADLTDATLTVRSAFASRVIARDEIDGFVVPDDKHVHVLLRNGATVRIPTARPRDLPRLRQLLFDYVPDEPPE